MNLLYHKNLQYYSLTILVQTFKQVKSFYIRKIIHKNIRLNCIWRIFQRRIYPSKKLNELPLRVNKWWTHKDWIYEGLMKGESNLKKDGSINLLHYINQNWEIVKFRLYGSMLLFFFISITNHRYLYLF